MNFFKSFLISSTLFALLYLFTGCSADNNNYYSVDDFYSVEKIDTHVHLNVMDPVVIEQAINDNMKLITLNVNSGRVPVTHQQDVATQLKAQYPDQLAYTTAFSLENWDDSEAWQQQALDYLQESFERGAFGVKVWKNIGMELINEDGEFVMIDDPQFDPIFEYLSDGGYVLYGHIGEPRNCWLPLEEMTVNNDRDYFENHPQYHMYLNPDYPSYEEIIEARNNMLDKNPDLTFFAAHLGSMEWSIEMMSEHLDRYPNMILGMAHRIPHLQYLAQEDYDKLRDFFITYQDRFVYSTDLMHYEESVAEEVRQLAEDTWREDWEFFVTDNELEVWQVEGSFKGLKLPKEVVNKIYHENARRWMPGIGI